MTLLDVEQKMNPQNYPFTLPQLQEMFTLVLQPGRDHGEERPMGQQQNSMNEQSQNWLPEDEETTTFSNDSQNVSHPIETLFPDEMIYQGMDY